MKPHDNPYGVGYSGEDFVTHHGTCECCQFYFEYKTPRKQPRKHTTCEDCTGHTLTGSEQDHIDALYGHLDKYRTVNLDHQDRIRELEQEVRNIDASRLRAQNAINSFKTRHDTAVAKLDALDQFHSKVGNHCQCGARWPCRTTEIINPKW